MKASQVLIVALVGASASGKSTLARRAANELSDVEIVKLDDFFKDANEFPIVGPFRNWEVPENVKFDELYRCLMELKRGRCVSVPQYSKREGLVVGSRIARSARVVIAEGFLLLHDARVRQVVDFIAYLKVDRKMLRERRLMREPRLDRRYYDHVVVPAFDAQEPQIETLANVTINSNNSVEAVWQDFSAILVNLRRP